MTATVLTACFGARLAGVCILIPVSRSVQQKDITLTQLSIKG